MKTEIKFVSKGWGFEKWIVNKEEYCGKFLFFAKGKKCSWHFHKLKDEVFYIQSGKVTIHFSNGDDFTKSESHFKYCQCADCSFGITVGSFCVVILNSEISVVHLFRTCNIAASITLRSGPTDTESHFLLTCMLFHVVCSNVAEL